MSGLHSVMRYSYLAGWVCLVLGLAYRLALFATGSGLVRTLQFEPRTLLIVGGLFFVICIASAAHMQADQLAGNK